MTKQRSDDRERKSAQARDRKDAVRTRKQPGGAERSATQGIENDERGQLQPADRERAQKNR